MFHLARSGSSLFVGKSISAVTMVPNPGSLRRSNLPLGKASARGCTGPHFLSVVTLTILFCSFVRINAYPKCSILSYLLLSTVVNRRIRAESPDTVCFLIIVRTSWWIPSMRGCRESQQRHFSALYGERDITGFWAVWINEPSANHGFRHLGGFGGKGPDLAPGTSALWRSNLLQ